MNCKHCGIELHARGKHGGLKIGRGQKLRARVIQHLTQDHPELALSKRGFTRAKGFDYHDHVTVTADAVYPEETRK